MSKNRILAIEDDDGVCRLLRHSLAREDYQVDVCHRGEDGLEAAIGNPPDLLLLDLDLPGMDGLTVCDKLKQHPVTRSLPIIILTGKGDEADVVQGLELGADDYIVKPFSPKILNARVHAVLRRRKRTDASAASDEVFLFGSLEIDASSNCIKNRGVEIDLNPSEYRFALMLICALAGEDDIRTCEIMPLEEDHTGALGREGMALYAENRLGRLLPVFDAISEIGPDSPILYGLYGLALLETDPQHGKQCLDNAAEQYSNLSEPRGELVILSILVFYHVFFDGDTKAAERFLDRAEVLNKAYFDRLSVFSRIVVAQNLALGRAFLFNDFVTANDYLSLAEALAEDRGLINLVVLNRLISIYEAYVKGDHELMTDGLEENFRFVNHPQVSILHKALLKIIQIRFFCLIGRYDHAREQKKQLARNYHGFQDQENLGTAMLVISRLEGLLSEERFAETFKLSTDVLQRPAIAGNDFTRPVLNGIRALSAACSGDTAAAYQSVEAWQEDAEYLTFNSTFAGLFCGRALARIGENDQASRILARIEPKTRENGWHNLLVQARAQQILLQSESGRFEADLLETLMSDLEKRDVWHLKSLLGDDYLRLYRLAAETRCSLEFSRRMIRNRLRYEIDRDGNSYPILQIRTLGELEIHVDKNRVARTDDFSRTQRECLALLAAAPGHRLSQEEVQLTFWPDSRPVKARSTLDTMLSRLRRTLKGKLQPYPVRNYLKLQKGVLSLEAVQVDADEAEKNIVQAREFMRRREFWQADVAFAMAFSYWQGPFMPGVCSADRSAVYARELQQTFADAVLEWNKLLNESGQVKRSLETLGHAASMDRCNESIMRALFRAHMRDGNISRAYQLLQEFDSILRAEGYSASETARVITSFKTAN